MQCLLTLRTVGCLEGDFWPRPIGLPQSQTLKISQNGNMFDLFRCPTEIPVHYNVSFDGFALPFESFEKSGAPFDQK